MVRYVVPGENTAAVVSIINSSGRLVWSGRKISSHKGVDAISCPLGDFGTGVYIVKVCMTDAAKRYLAEACTVALANRK